MREVGWVVFLAGLPFSYFLVRQFADFRHLDIWHANTAYSQLWLVLLACMAIAQPCYRLIPSRAFAAWIGWVGVASWWIWNTFSSQQKTYPLPLLMGVIHGLFIGLFYLLATSQWDAVLLKRIMRSLAWSGVVVMVYAWLQAANLDQFFTNNESVSHRDLVVGTIGNTSHFAAYLAFTLPLLLWQTGQRWSWWIAVVSCAALLVLTHSASGLIAGWVGTVVSVWHRRRWIRNLVLLVGGVAVFWAALHPQFFNPHGRLVAWKEFWEVYHKKPILGQGIGFLANYILTVPSSSPIFQWRHTHNEWFQIAIEQGIIGLGMVSWFVVETFRTWWRIDKTPEVMTLGALGMTFVLISVVNWPMHLWMLGSFGLVAACGLRVLAEG